MEMRKVRGLVVVMSTFLALGGVTLAYVATNAKKPTKEFLDNQPRHPVTPDMLEAVKKLNLKPAPYFRLPDTNGKPTVIGGQGEKPQFIYSVKKGCPCSFDAEPILNRLYKHFEGKVDFIAITDATGDDAKKWVLDLKVPYSVVPDGKLEVLRAFESPASVYCTLVDVNGVILKRWPGYSKQILGEMVTEMSKLVDIKPGKFDTQYAPDIKTSGCDYEGFETKPAS